MLEHLGHRLFAEWCGPAALDEFAPSAADDPDLRTWWARMLRTGASPRSASQLLALYRDIDVRGILGSITRPTLVLHRTGDRMVHATQGRYLGEHIAGARLVELPGGLPLWWGQPDLVLGVVEEFLIGARHGVDRYRVVFYFSFSSHGSTAISRDQEHLGDRWLIS